ncbi:MAG: Clp protease N-terminal domain-containing protein, partial [Pseudomonadota bacterium]
MERNGAVPVNGPGWLGHALGEAESHGQQIWVDSTVLKCCNQAYELAVAHRAPEVRLEHLVHAMTLVPTAVEILRSEGVSDATLRRESGIIIAHDIPSVSANGKFAPETSEEMEDTLRHAAGRAYQMRSPVTIDDILQTLFDMTRDIPTRNLISRHRADWTIRDPGEPRRFHEAPRDRIRMPQRASVSEAPETMLEPPSRTDTAQNTRIDELERTVGHLTDLLAKFTRAELPQVE